MSQSRVILLVVSCVVVVVLAGGGLALRVGAADGSYRDVVLFSEVLALISDNYVDAVDGNGLLEGAYEGMLGSLDPNGAYLSPEEVEEWKSPATGAAGPGLTGVKVHGSLEVVYVDPGSPAADLGIVRGDQIREIDGRPVRTMSQEQARRLLRGESGSSVKLELLHPHDSYSRETVDVLRAPRAFDPYVVEVVDGIAVLGVRDLERLDVGSLAEELDDVSSRGVDRLLLDFRALTEGSPRDIVGLVELFASGPLFRLKGRSGDAIETVEAKRLDPVWSGTIGILVNGATAGGGEAATLLLKHRYDVKVYGETTYGLGAEPQLFELPDGSGLVFPTGVWETADGNRWNETGVEPDEIVRAEETESEEIEQEQLRRALESFARDTSEEREDQSQKEAA